MYNKQARLSPMYSSTCFMNQTFQNFYKLYPTEKNSAWNFAKLKFDIDNFLLGSLESDI
jgi:hypothetical protein